jgi:hypothetical protein
VKQTSTPLFVSVSNILSAPFILLSFKTLFSLKKPPIEKNHRPKKPSTEKNHRPKEPPTEKKH